MRSPSRMNTLRPKLSPSERVTPKSRLKSLPAYEYQGIVQPMRRRYDSIWASGARETSASAVARVEVGRMPSSAESHSASKTTSGKAHLTSSC